MTTTQTAAKTYVLRSSGERYYGEATNRQAAERALRQAVRSFGGCFVLMVGDEIVSLGEKVNGRVRVTWL